MQILAVVCVFVLLEEGGRSKPHFAGEITASELSSTPINRACGRARGEREKEIERERERKRERERERERRQVASEGFSQDMLKVYSKLHTYIRDLTLKFREANKTKLLFLK